MLENLESRRLFAVSLHGGVLTLTGTVNPEGWEIKDPLFVNTGTGKLQVFRNGAMVGEFEPSDVQSIVLNLGAGKDRATFRAVSKPALILGGDGDDRLVAGGAQHTIVGGRGNDDIGPRWGAGPGLIPATLIEVIAGPGNDIVTGMQDLGTVDADARLIVEGGGGNDSIVSQQSIDRISCGEGDDTVFANPGNDRIDGNAGNDLILGDFGNDRITGGDGDDSLYGGEQNDTIDGGAGRDRIIAHNGDDVIFARDKRRDTVHGDNGNDSAQVDDTSTVQDLFGEIETML